MKWKVRDGDKSYGKGTYHPPASRQMVETSGRSSFLTSRVDLPPSSGGRVRSSRRATCKSDWGSRQKLSRRDTSGTPRSVCVLVSKGPTRTETTLFPLSLNSGLGEV